MKSNVFSAKELLFMSKEKLWSTLTNMETKKIFVIFDDGVLKTLPNRTLFSVSCWDIIKFYNETPLLTNFHIGKGIDECFNSLEEAQRSNEPFKNVILNSRTHMSIIGNILFKCYEHYNKAIDIEDLCRIAYENVNDIHNVFSEALGGYVDTLSILDFIDIVELSGVKEINNNVQLNAESINKTYSNILSVLKDNEELKDNSIVQALSNDIVNKNQVLQSIGPRGFLTDINSRQFNVPIVQGYLEGITKIEDIAKETRLGSKALLFQDDPLQQTEYFNREMQLVTSFIENLHIGDCKSNYYIDWIVHNNDLKNLQGTYYLQENGKLGVIKIDSIELIGTCVKLRSPLLCQHPDEQGICSVCFGDLSLSIPRNTNLGYVSAATLCEIISQSVLGTKHHEHVDGENELKLNENEQKYLKLQNHNSLLYLVKPHVKNKVSLLIHYEDAMFLNDINFVENIETLEPMRISNINQFSLKIEKNGFVDYLDFNFNYLNKIGHLTHHFLEYVKQTNFKLTEENYYLISLDDWDYNKPFIEMPKIHVNMLKFMGQIKHFLFNSKKRSSNKNELDENEIVNYVGRKLKDFDTHGAALQALYALVTSRLSINISHLAVIIKTFTAVNPDEGDFSLPGPSDKVTFVSHTAAMIGRSLAPAMAWEQRLRIINNPQTYLIEKRHDHYLDNVLIFANEK